MPRAYWKGHLRLSLVTCPIELFPATSQAVKTHFHQINTQTGHRLRQQMVDEETGRVVDAEHKRRGYELSKGKYVEIDEDELKAIQIGSTHTIDIDGFVARADIDKRYLDKPYYIAPDGKTGVEAFVVIRDAMQDQERVALARIVMAHREHMIMLEPRALITKSAMRTTIFPIFHPRISAKTWSRLPRTSCRTGRPSSIRENSRMNTKARCASWFSARPRATPSRFQNPKRSQAT
jgi:Ku protein